MGKIVTRSSLETGERLSLTKFATVAAANAAGCTATKYPGRIIYLTLGGTGSVPTLAFSDGVSWKQVAIGVAAI